MKKLTLIIAMFCATLNSYATEPILSTIHLPVYGDTRSMRFYSHSSVSPGNAGFQNWDFSGLSYSSTIYTENFRDPDATTSGSSFPSSDLAFVDWFGATYYYAASTTNLTLYGNSNFANTQRDIYTEGRSFLSLPISYNQSQNDTYSGNSYNTTSGTSLTISGTVVTSYDAYGSIVTIHGSFSDVVRIKTLVTETRTNTANGSVSTVEEEYYDWYTVSTGKLVFRVYIKKTTTTSGSVTSKVAYSYNYPVVSNVSGSESTGYLLVQENPVVNDLVLDTHLISGGLCYVSIFNATGVEVLNSEVSIGESSLTVNVEGLEEGIYYVRITCDQMVYIDRFYKKH